MDGEIIFRGDKPFIKCNRKEFQIPSSLNLDKDAFEGVYVDDITITGEGRNEKIIFFKIGATPFNLEGNQVNEPQNEIRNMQPDNTRKSAKAPYNFVPLNHTLVKSDASEKHSDFSNFHGNSGYIDIEVENKTHLYVRGEKEAFFKMGKNGKYAIPGSSFRGLIRTMVEICSYGKFGFFDDRKLFYRKPGANAATNRNIGFLNFENGKYVIHVAQCNPIPFCGSNEGNKFTYKFSRYNSDLYIEIYSGVMHGTKNFKLVYSKGNEQYNFNKNVIENYKDDDSRNIDREMKDILNLVKEQNLEKIISNYYDYKDAIYIGIPVWYELNGTKVKHFGHCKNYRLPYEKSIGDNSHIPFNVHPGNPENFNKVDFATSIFGNSNEKYHTAGKVFFEDLLIKKQEGFTENILQILANPKPTSFQLYLNQPLGVKTPKARLNTWNNANKAAIRGYKQYWHRNTHNAIIPEYNWAKMIFTEKEIEKMFKINSSEIKELTRENGPIERILIYNEYQYKLRTTYNLTEELKHDIFDDDKSTYQFTIINALNPKAEFAGRIRFDNLTDAELGAIMFALNLPDKCCHKIGMGKPHGLGSIRVSATLKIIDRKKRYEGLLENDNKFELSIKPSEKDYRTDFKDYIFGKLKITEDIKRDGMSDANSFDELHRIKCLCDMLCWDELKMKCQKWLKETSYMPFIGNKIEYKQRWVLPNPQEVIKSV